MSRNRHNLQNHEPNLLIPDTKLKNITCVFCRHHFYVRDITHLGGSLLPLLMNCGHSLCSTCAKTHINDPCPTCSIPSEDQALVDNSALPVNVYIIGVIGVSHARPVHGDEADIMFANTKTAKQKRRSIEQGFCFECGKDATLRCVQCSVLYCHKCYSKIHGKALQKHFKILLPNTFNKEIFETKTCTEHDESLDYYCNECCLMGCAHCMLQFHMKHNIVHLADKNEELLEDFEKTYDKLAETWYRVHQAQKKLQRLLVFPGDVENCEAVETAVTQHCTYLHGIVQNIEKRLIHQLHEQRTSLMNNLMEIQQQLKMQEDQLQSGLLTAATARENIKKINLQDVIPKLEKLAEMPCHLVENFGNAENKITFSFDTSAIELFENHCKVVIPLKSGGYNLQGTENLPEDYELEPLNSEETHKLWSQVAFPSNTPQMSRSCSLQTLDSTTSTTPTKLNERVSIPVQICYVENPSNFYVRQMSNSKKYLEMQHHLNSYGNRGSIVPDKIIQNELYVVKFATANKWYRGRVKSINVNSKSVETYEVFSVDFGSMDNRVPKSRIRRIPEQLATIPVTVINCALYDIVPIEGQWSPSARDTMFNLVKYTKDTVVTMHVSSVEGTTYYVDICKTPSKTGECSVSLRDVLVFLGHGTLVSSDMIRRTTPQAMLRFFREEFLLDSFYPNAKCCHVESPDCIYVQKDHEHTKYANKLMNEMTWVYNNEPYKSQSGFIYVPEKGMPCAVKVKNNKWFRGLIIDVPKPKTVQILLVDVGWTVKTEYSNIRRLHEKYMGSAAQAIKVLLAHIKPPDDDDEWSDKAITYTKKHLQGQTVQIIAFEKNEQPEPCYSSAIYLDNEINFASALLKKRLAVSKRPSSLPIAQKSPVLPPKTKKNKTSKIIPDEVIADPYRIRVVIIRTESPDIIYVADPTQETAYKQMMQSMQTFYDTKESTARDDFEVDTVCAVYSARDKMFCRGKITALQFEDEVEVFLFDMGVTEKFPLANIQHLKKSFWDTPAYAFKVKLAGIFPCGGSSKWPSASCEKLQEIMYEYQNSKFFISTVSEDQEDELAVDLWVEEVRIDGPLMPARYEIISVNRMLVETGLALPIREYKDGKSRLLAIELKRQICQKEISGRDESDRGSTTNDENIVESEQGTVLADDDSTDHDVYETDSSTESENAITHVSIPDSIHYTAWLPAEPINEDKFTAVVTFLDYDCYVYLHHQSKSAGILKFIENTLNSEYQNMPKELCDIKWEIGDPCIAQYHDNRKWYRGQVRRVLNNGHIEVEFIDYGNIEECEIGTVHKRLTLAHFPRLSTKCTVHGLKPKSADRKWELYNLDRIHAVLVDRECQVAILKRNSSDLVISITINRPVKGDLIAYLKNELMMNLGNELSDNLQLEPDESEQDSTKCETLSSADTSYDVIIDGYIKHDDNDSLKVVEKDEPDILETVENSILALDIDEIGDSSYSSEEPVNIEDVVITGTANFTHSAEQIETSYQEATNNLENGTAVVCATDDDDIVSSTPCNQSFSLSCKTFQQLEITEDVKSLVVEAGPLIDVTEIYLHLLDNKEYEDLSNLRHQYDEIMRDMQVCAIEQPCVDAFDYDTPCCTKFTDGMWYRCTIMRIEKSDPESVAVRFVDWGNYGVAKMKSIRALKDEWFKAPVMAFKCRLWGITVSADKTDTDENLCRVAQCYEPSMQNLYIEIKSQSDTYVDVQIYKNQECTELVYQSLIEEGFFLTKHLQESKENNDENKKYEIEV